MNTKHLLLILTLGVVLTAQAAKPAGPADPGWPREITREGTRLVYHQPQIDEWKNYRQLKARIAFSITPKDGQPAVGIAELEGSTVANLEARTVFIQNLKITKARFPSLPEAEATAMEARLKKLFPGKSITVSLDRLMAGAERGKEAFAPVEVKMDPTTIFTTTQPAALLIVDGEPVRAPLGATGLEFVVNTNWDLFFEPASKRYFLLSDKTWLTAEALDGQWTLATKVSAALAKAPKDWDHMRWMRAGHVATDESGVLRWQGSEGGGKVRWNDDHAAGIARHDDNLYAGKDGNVYRRDDDGNWAKFDSGEWENVDKPDRGGASSQSAADRENDIQQKASDRKPPTGSQPQRPGTAERPTALPADTSRPQSGNRPQTTPAERQRPKNTERASIEQRPSTRPAQTQPSADVMKGLNRESSTRTRGSFEASRQQNFQRGSGGAGAASRSVSGGAARGGGGRRGR